MASGNRRLSPMTRFQAKNAEESYREQLLAIVRREGRIGKIRLGRELREQGWDDLTYESLRNRLIDEGTLKTLQGGGLRVSAEAVNEATSETSAESEPPSRAQKRLYEAVLAVIQGPWAKSMGLIDNRAWISAGQPVKGKPTSPEVILLAKRDFPYYPGHRTVWDIVTFEVKLHERYDFGAVYEALAHRRSATRTYVLLELPSYVDGKEQNDRSLGALVSEASRHGVGFIVASNPSKHEGWHQLVEPERFEPDPEDVNKFLGQELERLRSQEQHQDLYDSILRFIQG